MRVVDFTHVIRREMPVYPGTPQPRLEPAGTYARDGFRATQLTIDSHTGTHMDAPAHLFPAGATLDALPPECFLGMALVVSCAGAGEGSVLHVDRLAPVRDAADRAGSRHACPCGQYAASGHASHLGVCAMQTSRPNCTIR